MKMFSGLKVIHDMKGLIELTEENIFPEERTIYEKNAQYERNPLNQRSTRSRNKITQTGKYSIS
jgi:hypothetical protein